MTVRTTSSDLKVPIRGSYWVVPGRLLAGEYPGTVAAKLRAFAEARITSFVDLTEPDEGLAPYAAVVPGLRHVRMAIPDFDCPSREDMVVILDTIDDELARGENVYVHCWGGRGRTGTVIGCWLVRHGSTGEKALRRVAELRKDVPDAQLFRSPETYAQRDFVRRWPEAGVASAPP